MCLHLIVAFRFSVKISLSFSVSSLFRLWFSFSLSVCLPSILLLVHMIQFFVAVICNPTTDNYYLAWAYLSLVAVVCNLVTNNYLAYLPFVSVFLIILSPTIFICLGDYLSFVAVLCNLMTDNYYLAWGLSVFCFLVFVILSPTIIIWLVAYPPFCCFHL